MVHYRLHTVYNRTFIPGIIFKVDFNQDHSGLEAIDYLLENRKTLNDYMWWNGLVEGEASSCHTGKY